jgi:hypothetical protein
MPGASFAVNGAVPVDDAALITASAELKRLNGLFDGAIALTGPILTVHGVVFKILTPAVGIPPIARRNYTNYGNYGDTATVISSASSRLIAANLTAVGNVLNVILSVIGHPPG